MLDYSTKVFIRYGELNIIIRIEPKYGREKMTCHLWAKLCEDGMGIHEHHECSAP
jgi:hypothetical protein